MKELYKGIIYSIVLHIVLLLLFSSININLRFNLPEFIEIALPVEAKVEKKEAGKEKVAVPVIKPTKEKPEIYEKKEEKKEVSEEEAVEKITPAVEDRVVAEAYTITGEIAKRRVVYKVVPKYPEGYNVHTEVSVLVFVLPDGSIGRLRIVKRGGVPFDEITLNALREWKFEPLPLAVPQVTQQGIITFIYKLK